VALLVWNRLFLRMGSTRKWPVHYLGPRRVRSTGQKPRSCPPSPSPFVLDDVMIFVITFHMEVLPFAHNALFNPSFWSSARQNL
jgi:hypothetical protein